MNNFPETRFQSRQAINFNRIILVFYTVALLVLVFNLAEMYEVEIRVLNQTVKRNINRFPSDFMFELRKSEFDGLRSQFMTSNRGGLRYMPFAFTEQGVAMLASVLRSKKAIQLIL